MGKGSAATNPLSKAYYAVEDKYYDLMDWLQAKGAKVYEWFVEPIEKRGIPSFPIAVFLILAIAIGSFAFLSQGSSANVGIENLLSSIPGLSSFFTKAEP